MEAPRSTQRPAEGWFQVNPDDFHPISKTGQARPNSSFVVGPTSSQKKAIAVIAQDFDLIPLTDAQRFAAANAENKRLAGVNAQLTDEVFRLKKEGAGLKATTARLETSVIQLQTENDRLAAEAVSAQGKNVLLQEKNRKLQQEAARLEEAVKEAKTKNAAPVGKRVELTPWEVLGLDEQRFKSMPKAQQREVIDKMRRIFGGLYHPDNKVTGNLERMQETNQALDCLEKEI